MRTVVLIVAGLAVSTVAIASKCAPYVTLFVDSNPTSLELADVQLEAWNGASGSLNLLVDGQEITYELRSETDND